MIEITFPDGASRSYEINTSPYEIASSISEGLARNIISANFNNQTIETSSKLTEDGKLIFYTWNDKEGKKAFWHSSAHVLAQVIEEFYPGVKLTIGPAINNGFYYDVDFGEHIMSEKDFPKIDGVAYPSKRIKDQVLALNNLEEFAESTFLPVTDSEKSLFATRGISSGYSLVKDQVDCPFRSFARHRLNSQHYQTPEVDLDNLDRGNVIHKALELFWTKTANLKNLLTLSTNSLEQQLEQFVREAIKICSERTSGQTQFNKLEIERNVRVIHDWLLAVELKRTDFKVIHNEEDVEINLSGIKLTLRIDRIDEIPGKGLLLIDYKTGRDAKTTDWFGEKIRGPQLPLYTLAKPPAGLAYGHLVIGKPEFKGTTIKELPLGEFKNQDFTKASGYSSWEELLDYWKNNLNSVADEFLQGNHRVSPINKGEPCRHCEFSSLCRIQTTNRGSG